MVCKYGLKKELDFFFFFFTCDERLAAELAVHWCMMRKCVEGMREMHGAAATVTHGCWRRG